jgi:hypothetical protein
MAVVRFANNSNRKDNIMAESTQKTQEICVTCRWWSLDTDSKVGNCHKSPPTRNKENTLCCWPPTSWADWCGAFELAKAEALQIRKAILRPPEALKQDVVTKSQDMADLLNSIDLSGIK